MVLKANVKLNMVFMEGGTTLHIKNGAAGQGGACRNVQCFMK